MCNIKDKRQIFSLQAKQRQSKAKQQLIQDSDGLFKGVGLNPTASSHSPRVSLLSLHPSIYLLENIRYKCCLV